jgi:hypothetical protein
MQIKQLGTVFRIDLSIKFVIHKKFINNEKNNNCLFDDAKRSKHVCSKK